MKKFDYLEAFSRNIGWVTREELQILRNKKVAIAGLGGVGGVYLITLARLGIGSFNIADMDTFELANFNRQYGATMNTIGKQKCKVMKDAALELNPELKIKTFNEGITEKNVEEFLYDCDLYLDGMDLFCMAARNILFHECTKKNIPAISIAPLGMSASLAVCLPEKYTYEDYFCLNGLSSDEQVAYFLAGMAPRLLHIPYLVDPSTVDLKNKRGPSTPMACQLCSGICGTEVLKILLQRGKIACLPTTLQFDAFRQKYVKVWRPGGNKNPMQKLLIKFMLWKFSSNKGSVA